VDIVVWPKIELARRRGGLGKVGGMEGDVASATGDGSQVSTFKWCTLEAIVVPFEKTTWHCWRRQHLDDFCTTKVRLC
jgi:hypothetical protein